MFFLQNVGNVFAYLKPYKLGLSKVEKLKTILLYFIQVKDIFCKISPL